MKTRIISALIALPLALFLIYFGGLPLYLACGVMSLIGLYELYKAFESKNMGGMLWLGVIFTIGAFGVLYYFKDYVQVIFAFYFLIISLLFVTLACIVFLYPRYNIMQGVVTIFGYLYVVFPILHIYLLRDMKEGAYFIWFLFLTAWATDTFAYFAGVTMGKRKICPQISPNKTFAGAVGGVLGSIVVNMIYAYFISSKIEGISFNSLLLIAIVIGILGAVFAQFGDLAASLIKRYVGIKDYGNIMPGHGGVLDRFDSVIFIAPIIYFVFLLI